MTAFKLCAPAPELIRVGHSIEDVRSARAIVFPGMGSFNGSVRFLASNDLKDTIIEAIHGGTALFSVCGGLQMIAKTSEEFGTSDGLGIIDAKAISFSSNHLKRTNVGCRKIFLEGNYTLFKNIPADALFYFCHSYRLAVDDSESFDEYGISHYGIPYLAYCRKRNVFGFQFHPELSQPHGYTIIKNFIKTIGM